MNRIRGSRMASSYKGAFVYLKVERNYHLTNLYIHSHVIDSMTFPWKIWRRSSQWRRQDSIGQTMYLLSQLPYGSWPSHLKVSLLFINCATLIYFLSIAFTSFSKSTNVDEVKQSLLYYFFIFFFGEFICICRWYWVLECCCSHYCFATSTERLPPTCHRDCVATCSRVLCKTTVWTATQACWLTFGNAQSIKNSM